jgi:phosphopantothenoylcysteine synthetase/decarboxylase
MATNPLPPSPSPARLVSAHARPLHFLVTAGSTREKIDEVRDWGNIFTGKTGLDVALAFLELGSVTLLTSNLQHAQEYDGYAGKGGMIGTETFRSHRELQDLLAERMTSGDPVDVVAMSAAIADYRPSGVFRIVQRQENAGRETWVVENVQAGKVKSTFDHIAIVGERTLKLVDQFRGEWGYRGLLVKFKLEVGLTDDELIRVASASRLASGAELMVANTLAMARPVDGSERAAYLIWEGGTQRVPRSQLAESVKQWVEHRLKAAHS